MHYRQQSTAAAVCPEAWDVVHALQLASVLVMTEPGVLVH